jgi:hypothetical protein
VIGASNTPSKNRQIAIPVKLLDAAVIINMAPHAIIFPETTFAILVFCARNVHGYSASRYAK